VTLETWKTGHIRLDTNWVDAVLPVLDEGRYFPCTGRFKDFRQLSDGLFENLGRTYVDFGNDNHDRHIECKCNTQMLSGLISNRPQHDVDPIHSLAHAYKTVVCSDHQQTVVGLRRQQTKDGGAQVPLVACQISEANDFRLDISVKSDTNVCCNVQIAVQSLPR
jgi:hypothetical protein